jgi:DNA-binding YbaB/EbfC family protein
MFGLNKIKEAKEQAELLRQKLDATQFTGISRNSEVTAVINGTKHVESIEINDSVFKIRSREEVQELIVEAINQANIQADAKIRDEMQGILPNIPGLNL